MSNMLFGRYIPYNTILHKLDSRIKLLSFICILVSIFLNYGTTFQNFIMYGIFLLIMLVLCIVGKVSIFSILKSLLALWLMMLILLIINCFLVTQGNILFSIGSLDIHDEAIYRSVYIIVRLLLMIFATSILTNTTKPMELTYALEWILTPLKFCKGTRIAIHIFAMTFTLALRFIPTLADEANMIIQAQSCRGVDIKHGKLGDRFKGLISLIIPLFVSCFLKSDELANAMDARGYNPLEKRTRFNKRKWDLVDTFCLIGLLIFLSGVIFLAIMQYDFVSMIRGCFNG